jgi:hypothetical protein
MCGLSRFPDSIGHNGTTLAKWSITLDGRISRRLVLDFRVQLSAE